MEAVAWEGIVVEKNIAVPAAHLAAIPEEGEPAMSRLNHSNAVVGFSMAIPAVPVSAERRKKFREGVQRAESLSSDYCCPEPISTMLRIREERARDHLERHCC